MFFLKGVADFYIPDLSRLKVPVEKMDILGLKKPSL